jgi:hypothetical protein
VQYPAPTPHPIYARTLSSMTEFFSHTHIGNSQRK